MTKLKYAMAQYIELAQNVCFWAGRIADTAWMVSKHLTEIHHFTEYSHVEDLFVQVVALDVDDKRVGVYVE